MIRESRLIGRTIADVNAQRTAAGAAPVSVPTTRTPYAASTATPPTTATTALRSTNVGSGATLGNPVYFGPAAGEPGSHSGDPNYVSHYDNPQRPTAVVESTSQLNQMLRSGLITQNQFNAGRTQLMAGSPGVNPFGFAAEGEAFVNKAGEDAVNEARKNGISDPAYLQTIDQNARQNALTKQQTEQIQQGNYSSRESDVEQMHSAASAAGKGAMLKNAVDQRKNKRLNAQNTGAVTTPGGDTGATTPMTKAPQHIGSQTGFNTYMNTLTPEQQQMMAPLQYGLDELDSTLGGVAESAKTNMLANDLMSDESYNRQGALLDMAQTNLNMNKEETQSFLRDQMNLKNQNLLAQRDNQKQWLQLDEQQTTRALENDKAKMVVDMAFAAAVNGGTFSSSTSTAISQAEMQASQKIAEVHAQYGLKAADVDMAYTSAYTELNTTYMQGMIEALQDYRSKSIEVMGMRFSSEETRSKAKQQASDTYINTLNGLAMTKAGAINTAINTAMSTLATSRAADQQQKQWDADYRYKVDKDNRDFDLNNAKFAEDIRKNASDATEADFTANRDTVAFIQNMMKAPEIAKFEGTYKPSYKNFKIAYDQFKKTGDDASAQSAIKAYSGLLDAAVNTGDQGVVDTILSKFGMSSTTKVTSENLPQVALMAEKMFFNAKESRDAKISGIREQLNTMNAKIEDPRLKVSPLAAGIPYTPPILSSINSLPSDQRNVLKDMNIGGTTYNGPNELLQRMNAADQAFYEDFGSHIPFTLDSDGDRSYSVGVDGGVTQDMMPYLNGAQIGAPVQPNTSLTSFYQGKQTQVFNTPVADRAHGGLYDTATVEAWNHKHQGVDIAMPVGTEIVSPAEMTVVEAGKIGGWGYTVLAETPSGAQIRYSHLNPLPSTIKKGSKIAKGAMFAQSGNSGNSTGPHLDLRVRVNGNYVDPSSFIPS